MPETLAASGSRRAVLLVLAAGLLGMLAVAGLHLLQTPALVVEHAAPQDAAPTGKMGMDPDVGKLMQHIKDNPTDLRALLHLSEHLIQQQSWDAAELFVRRAMTLAPSDAYPLYLLGMVQHSRGDHAAAAVSLEQVVQLQDTASTRYSLGILYAYYLKDAGRAAAHLQAGLRDPRVSAEEKAALQDELKKLSPIGGTAASGDAKAMPAEK